MEKLESLLKVQWVEFTLPITKESQTIFDSTASTSAYKAFVGVYVFTHIATGSMYVSSSNLLKRRMHYYFYSNTFNGHGLFLPLFNRDVVSAFKLKIAKLDINRFNVIYCLFFRAIFITR